METSQRKNREWLGPVKAKVCTPFATNKVDSISQSPEKQIPLNGEQNWTEEKWMSPQNSHNSVKSETLRKGGFLWKIPFHSQGPPRRRWFKVRGGTLADNTPMRLEWHDPAKASVKPRHVLFSNIHEVLVGQKTSSFLCQGKIGNLFPLSHCFSVVTNKRTVDLVANNNQEAELWIDELSQILNSTSTTLTPNTCFNNSDRGGIIGVLPDSYINTSYLNVSTSQRGQGDINREKILREVFHHCYNNDVMAVSSILEKGVIEIDALEPIEEGDSLLVVACRIGNSQIAELCLRYGATNDPHPEYGQTALQAAVSTGQFECTKLLLETASPSDMNQVIVNHADTNINAPIHLASLAGDVNMLKLLLEHGADICAVDIQGRTSLHCCCSTTRGRYYESVSLLVDYSDNTAEDLINLGDSNNNTPLHLAVLYSDSLVIRLLLESAANPLCSNFDKMTPYQLSVTRSDPESMALLREYESWYQRNTNHIDEVNIFSTNHMTNQNQAHYPRISKNNYKEHNPEYLSGREEPGEINYAIRRPQEHPSEHLYVYSEQPLTFSEECQTIQKEGNFEVWEKHYSEEGYCYYYCTTTGDWQWEYPETENHHKSIRVVEPSYSETNSYRKHENFNAYQSVQSEGEHCYNKHNNDDYGTSVISTTTTTYKYEVELDESTLENNQLKPSHLGERIRAELQFARKAQRQANSLKNDTHDPFHSAESKRVTINAYQTTNEERAVTFSTETKTHSLHNTLREGLSDNLTTNGSVSQFQESLHPEKTETKDSTENIKNIAKSNARGRGQIIGKAPAKQSAGVGGIPSPKIELEEHEFLNKEMKSVKQLVVKSESSRYNRNDMIMKTLDKTELEKYVSMKRYGVSEGSIQQKMKSEGKSESQIEYVLKQATNIGNEQKEDNRTTIIDESGYEEKEISLNHKSVQPPSPPETSKPRDVIIKEVEKNRIYAKYLKMKKMGIQIGAIKQGMIKDGLEDQVIELFLLAYDPSLATNGKTVRKHKTCTRPQSEIIWEVENNKKYAKYLKMKKMGIHTGAIKQGMVKDGLEDTDIELFLLAFDPSLASKGQALKSTEVQRKGPALLKLRWKALSSSSLKDTLWAETPRNQGLCEDELKSLEDMFAAKPVVKKLKGARQKTKPKRLFDIRRENNVGIGLCRMRKNFSDYQEIAKAIFAADLSKLDLATLELLSQLMPTKEERATLSRFKGDVNSMGEVAKFFKAMLPLTSPEMLINTLIFQTTFCERVLDLRKKMKVATNSCSQLHSSTKLKKVFELILTVGNAMNEGTSQGGAQGFTLDSLTKLVETKGNDRKTTVLDYVARMVIKRGGELSEIGKDMPDLKNASSVNITELCSQIKKVQMEIDKIIQFLNGNECDESFASTIQEFIINARKDSQDLDTLKDKMINDIRSTSNYFNGYDETDCGRTISSQISLFRSLHSFIIKFDKACNR